MISYFIIWKLTFLLECNFLFARMSEQKTDTDQRAKFNQNQIQSYLRISTFFSVDFKRIDNFFEYFFSP